MSIGCCPSLTHGVCSMPKHSCSLTLSTGASVGDKLRIIKVDVDRHSDVAAQWRIQSVPTLMLFRNGEVLYRNSGVMDKAELMALLDPFM